MCVHSYVHLAGISAHDKKKYSGWCKGKYKEPSILTIPHLNYHISVNRCMFRGEIHLKSCYME